MRSVFKVGFGQCWGKDRRETVYSETADQYLTVAARDAEDAIAKVRRKSLKERLPMIDKNGDDIRGKWQKCRDIVVTSVEYVDHDVDVR